MCLYFLKQRLVVRGFEEEGLQEIPKDSPTVIKTYLCNCSTERMESAIHRY